MRVLLVEPNYRKGADAFLKKMSSPARRKIDDESLWYPPIGLLKLSTFHKRRGDEVCFLNGYKKNSRPLQGHMFEDDDVWDRVYITTLFTYDWDNVVKTIEHYKTAVGGSSHKIYVGGIMASIMSKEIFEETGIQPIVGIINSPKQIDMDGDEDIDLMPLDYSLIDPYVYAINSTYYAYTTRGCTHKCKWCGVPEIEPIYQDYIDIKQNILIMREQYGDKPKLKLMDNNVLASPYLSKIVDDLIELGYGKGQYTDTNPKRLRVVDFNQGLEAAHIDEKTIKIIEPLNIRPMRIAFDKLKYKSKYISAVKISKNHGFDEFSNYMLYNEDDTPRDLYERISVNIELNQYFSQADGSSSIYSYPMRYAPVKSTNGLENRKRDLHREVPDDFRDYICNPVWNKRFVRNIEIIKGASHGCIPPKISFAKRAVGATYYEYLSNLYMSEEMLRNRNKYEKLIHEGEPLRPPGNGELEEFREFIMRLLSEGGERCVFFHNSVAQCSKEVIRQALSKTEDQEIKRWLKWYLI